MQMKYLLPVVTVFTLITGTLLADTRVRKLYLATDQIATVKTALGVATIIQVPDKPNSVVVGDMNAYKVEYLDTAITIKPLTAHAKSNLYIFTDFRRFNVQLVTGSENHADYVVYLESKQKVEPIHLLHNRPDVSWTPHLRTLVNDGLRMTSKRLGQTSKGLLFVELTIQSQKNVAFKPEWIWLTQGGVSRPIQGLILSSLSVSTEAPIQATIEILKSDVNENESMRVELRRKKMSFLKVPGVIGWKH